ncbi:hypothetical protein N7481_002634 [Penicillium waksmanii]|uniref:uncharacterized protein n=1 Tax=Penicillium waksmanii TaxID=69791 RepID=UPI00254795DF|nr:uncharacterized protein N7481_002634 [Penicillium waksmanii]KAJ5995657.1 hypothetical protein N7481_002634 [Penicillium waksmanii]
MVPLEGLGYLTFLMTIRHAQCTTVIGCVDIPHLNIIVFLGPAEILNPVGLLGPVEILNAAEIFDIIEFLGTMKILDPVAVLSHKVVIDSASLQNRKPISLNHRRNPRKIPETLIIKPHQTQPLHITSRSPRPRQNRSKNTVRKMRRDTLISRTIDTTGTSDTDFKFICIDCQLPARVVVRIHIRRF